MFTFWARPIPELFIEHSLHFFLPLLLFTFYTSLTYIFYCILLTWHYFRTDISYSGRSRGEAWAARAPLIFRPNWGPKGREKIFLRSPLSQDLDDRLPSPTPLYECLEPPLSYATQACLAVDCSQPQSRHQSLLGQLKRNVLNQWWPVRKFFLSNIPRIPHCQTFIALKISKDFVKPHSAMMNMTK